jgi:hypothetical protein
VGNRETKIVAFYRGDGRDHRGRSLADIHEFDFQALELHHDYIQWLFPLPEPSGANASAPLLTDDDIASFTSDPALARALRQSLELMLQFYGLELTASDMRIGVRKSGHFDERSQWLTRGNHNCLRISRILSSLSLLGLKAYALAFLELLEEIYGEEPDTIGTTTIGYWRRALDR